LTPDEKILIPLLVAGFITKTKENPVKSHEIVSRLNANKNTHGYKSDLTGARLRKMVNFIRVNSLIPLIATSDGYFVSYNKEEIMKEIKSMDERASAITGAANGLRIFTVQLCHIS